MLNSPGKQFNSWKLGDRPVKNDSWIESAG
jgi:hypothetical protein